MDSEGLHMKTVLTEFLQCREETIHVLVEVCLELQAVGKGVNKTNIVSKTVSVTAGAASLAFFVLAPATGGISAIGGVSLAGLSGLAAATSIGASVYQRIVDKGLLQNVKKALDKDERMADRLHIAAQTLRSMSVIAHDTATFLTKAVKLGLASAKEVRFALKMPETSKAVALAARVAQVTEKTSKALKIAGTTLAAISIPLDLISLIMDIKDCRDESYSKNAEKVWDMVLELHREYETIKSDMDSVLKALNDKAYVL